jgi:hypothetical protein
MSSPKEPQVQAVTNEPSFRGVDFNAARFLRMVGQANVELVAGTLEALGAGARAFGENLTDENVAQLGFRNGFVAGAFQSWVHTFGAMQDAWKRSFVILQPRPAPDSKPGGS